MVVGRLADELWPADGCTVDRDFIRPCIQQALYVRDLTDATAHGERDEDFAGNRFDNRQDQVAIVAGGRDVEKGELVSTLFVVAASDLDGITGIDQIDEVNALDDAARGRSEEHTSELQSRPHLV